MSSDLLRTLVSSEVLNGLTPQEEVQIVASLVDAVLADPDLVARLRELAESQLQSPIALPERD